MDKLNEIAELLAERKPGPFLTVREFLAWFGAKRRGYWIVREIRDELKAANLITVPNFEHQWIDGNITFSLRPDDTSGAIQETEHDDDGLEIDAADEADDPRPVWVSRDATHRISRLDAANQPIVFAAPDENVASVTTKMLQGGYSQLPVMVGDRTVKGIVSWQTIGSRLALGVEGTTAKDFMEPHHEISSERSIFDAISMIVANDYVLVRDRKEKLTGIITAADLSLQFRELTEPFLLLSEIENLVRNLIGENFEIDELRNACDSDDPERRARIHGVADLTFGEYVRLLEHKERWDQVGLQIDRVSFCRDLEEVREIRNDVMHFDPDGIDPDNLNTLRCTTIFLQKIARITDRYKV